MHERVGAAPCVRLVMCMLSSACLANEKHVHISEPCESLKFFTKERNKEQMKIASKERRNDKRKETKERGKGRQQARKKKVCARQASLSPILPIGEGYPTFLCKVLQDEAPFLFLWEWVCADFSNLLKRAEWTWQAVMTNGHRSI